MLAAARPVTTGLTSGPDRRRTTCSTPTRESKWLPAQSGASEERTMNRTKFLAGLCLTVFLAAVPAFAQSDAKQKEPQKPALTESSAILDHWNEIGRKLIDMPQHLPQDNNH